MIKYSYRKIIPDVTGSITSDSAQKWAPRTQWKSQGKGVVLADVSLKDTKKSIGLVVVKPDSGGESICFRDGNVAEIHNMEGSDAFDPEVLNKLRKSYGEGLRSEVIGFYEIKSAAINHPLLGHEVEVYIRSSPLGYNGNYCYEVVWLSPGDEKPEEYPSPLPREKSVSESLFGVQSDQAILIPNLS